VNQSDAKVMLFSETENRDGVFLAKDCWEGGLNQKRRIMVC
jgi:hypothetical protein